MKLKDQIAIITGGGRGMGRSHSLLLGSEGAVVIPVDINGPNAHAVAEEVRQAGGKAESYELDIMKGPDVRRVVKEVGEKYGRIDILVNNAGYDEVRIFSESDEEHWDWMIDLNYKGHLHVTHAALPYLKAAGNAKIVYISSDAARVGSTGEAVYAGAKAALMGFAKTLAREEARKKAEITRGEGDALAVKIFADAYGRDPEFYQLVRTLEAYRKSLGEDTAVILSPGSDFFRYLKHLDPPRKP